MGLILSWLYGVMAIASVFIMTGMARLWLERRVEYNRPEPDVYQSVLLYAGIHGLGGAIWWSVRAWDGVVNGRVNPGSFPGLVLVSAIAYVVGKAGLVYASKLNGKPGAWNAFVILSVAWSLLLWVSIANDFTVFE